MLNLYRQIFVLGILSLLHAAYSAAQRKYLYYNIIKHALCINYSITCETYTIENNAITIRQLSHL